MKGFTPMIRLFVYFLPFNLKRRPTETIYIEEKTTKKLPQQIW